MSTTTLAILRQRLSETIGDWLSSTVTTALAASTSVVDTLLANVEGGNVTDYFEDWWCYITSLANIGANRKVTAYSSSTYTLTVQGGNFTSDSSSKATYELHRISPAQMLRALNNAARELMPYLFKKVQDRNLVVGNALPDGSFEDWTSATALRFYTTTSNATLAKTTAAGLYRGTRGTTSAKITAGAASSYYAISSTTYPRLLDLQDESIDFKCWAYPEVADDAYIEIYTIKPDGTTQTLTSTTTCPAAKWTLLKLEDQELNDGLNEIQFRFKVGTDTKYAYFDRARVTGKSIRDYVLPASLSNGVVKKVRIQTSGYSDDICDDIDMPFMEDVFGWKVVNDGTYKYLRLPFYTSERNLELTGYAPLEDDLSSDTDTMAIDDPYTNLLIAQAAWELYRILRGLPSFDSTKLYDDEIAYWAAKTADLRRKLSMAMPSGQISWTV